jgi:hypothetical protein
VLVLPHGLMMDASPWTDVIAGAGGLRDQIPAAYRIV